ncbi:MAG: methionyl-tRNA formyltransferase, partial [Chitinophagaceae bacterium]|nr:methionyl-tRNA formyltransferase [Chitinophagaceae bacterium]
NFRDKTMKIYRSEKGTTTVGDSVKRGEHETDGRGVLQFACADGFILVKELQLEGKKRMNVEDFLRGLR